MILKMCLALLESFMFWSVCGCVCVFFVYAYHYVCYSVSKAPLTIKSRWDENVFRVRLFVKICV